MSHEATLSPPQIAVASLKHAIGVALIHDRLYRPRLNAVASLKLCLVRKLPVSKVVGHAFYGFVGIRSGHLMCSDASTVVYGTTFLSVSAPLSVPQLRTDSGVVR